MFCADVIDLYYFFKNICITRKYIIISGAARVGWNIIRVVRFKLFCFENGKKTSRRIHRHKNNITIYGLYKNLEDGSDSDIIYSGFI